MPLRHLDARSLNVCDFGRLVVFAPATERGAGGGSAVQRRPTSDKMRNRANFSLFSGLQAEP